VDLVDLFGAGRLALRLGEVILAGLAAGFLGLTGGLALGEGGGLALAGTGRLVELAAALVLSSQVTEASLKGLAAGTRDGLHTSIIGTAPAAAALPQVWSRDQLELDTLIKYREF
jgi:hypothetical protein